MVEGSDGVLLEMGLHGDPLAVEPQDPGDPLRVVEGRFDVEGLAVEVVAGFFEAVLVDDG